MKYARDFRESARAALSGKWGLAVGAGFVAALLGGSETGVFSSPSISLNSEQLERFFTGETVIKIMLVMLPISFLFAIGMFVLGSIVVMGYARFNLKLIDGETPEIGELFSFFPKAGKAIVTNLFRQLFIVLWSLLFLIPGIIAMYNYAMASYILAENPELSPREVLERSKEMMYGNRWRLFCLEISFIGWALLCVLTMGIGFLWLTPYMQAAMADFYRDVAGNRPVKTLPETEPVEPEQK